MSVLYSDISGSHLNGPFTSTHEANTPCQEPLSNLMFVRLTTLRELEKRYADDVMMHVASIAWFTASFFRFLVFSVIERLI